MVNSKKRIVFILGAGASIPFEFPSGEKLVELVAQSIRIGGVSPLLRLIRNNSYSANEIEKFRGLLLDSNVNSVDLFLEQRTEFIPLGKTAIAFNILEAEKVSLKFFNSFKTDWYRYLWNKLICPIENFPKTNVSFITFNYDRSLEYFLYKAFTAYYGNQKNVLADKIEVIHLHGKLGNLSWQNESDFIEYAKENIVEEDLIKMTESIKIIHEDIAGNANFERAHELLSDGKNLCVCLGFGYHEINIKRLRLDEITRTILGTSKGLTPNEINQIKRNFKNLSPYDNDCLSFLKAVISFD